MQRDEDLRAVQLIGYMLKVLKNDLPITKYRKEFNAIRHGDYDTFRELIQAEDVPIVQFSYGVIKTDGFSQKAGDSDATMLFLIGDAVIKFGMDCFSRFGDVRDADLLDITFIRAAAFEIALRMHVSKYRIERRMGPVGRDVKLEAIINELGDVLKLPEQDINVLHGGRRFLNMIKHKEKTAFKSWGDGVDVFKSAWAIREKHNLRIV